MRRKIFLVSVLFLLMLFAIALLMPLPVNAEESEVETTDVQPATVTIFTENFEGAWLGLWYCSDSNSDSGLDYWGLSTFRHAGTYAAWCAQIGDHPYGPRYYDLNMKAFMYRAVSLSAYSSVTLSYWYWTKCEPPAYDYLQVLYRVGTTWYYVDKHVGDSAGWQQSSFSIPNTAIAVGFYFYSDYITASYEGAYVDDVVLTGTPTTYSVTLNAACYAENAYISVPITKDGVYSGFSTLHTFTGLTGTHTFKVPSTDAAGHTFYEWSTGSTNTTITVSSAGTYVARYKAGAPPSVEIWTDKATYARGETLKAYIQGFNPGPAIPVRVKCWFGLSGGGTYLLETYYTGTLPTSYTSPVYLWKSVTIPYSAAVGTYSVNAEMRNPTTNALIDSDTWIWTVTPTEAHGAISIVFDDGEKSQYDYAFPLMQARGIVGTFYVFTDAIRDFSNSSAFMSIAELRALQDYGCEIASHSKTHPTFTGISDSQIRLECSVSKQVLQSYGFSADNFAYPYGGRNDHTDSIVAEYYRSARSAYHGPYIMQFPVSQLVLPGFAGETGDSTALPRLKSMVDQVYSTNGWAIIFFHNIIPDANNTPFTISSQDFESFLDYIIYRGVPTITVNQGLDLTSPPSPPPSVTISPTSVRMYIGQSQMFSSSVTGGNPPFSYQWYLNDTTVSSATGSTWTFTPATTGHYKVYLNVTDVLNFKAQSNIVTDIVVYPQLTVSISPFSMNMTVGASQSFSSAFFIFGVGKATTKVSCRLLWH